MDIAKKILYIFVLALWVSGGKQCRAQSTIHVPADQPTIQAAIDAAQSGDTVLVAPGIFNENIDFRGKAIIVTTGATAVANVMPSTIQGSQDGPVVRFVHGEAAQAKLNGFAITGGHASFQSRKNGGGILIDGASPTITNNQVVDNIGCGVLVGGQASPVISGNIISQTKNSAVGANITGGGSLCASSLGVASTGIGLAIISSGHILVESNVIENNNASPSQTVGTFGAGLYIGAASELDLFVNTIRNNLGQEAPGVAQSNANHVGKLVLIQNLIYGNTTSTSNPQQVLFVGSFFGVPPLPSIYEVNNTISGLGGQEFVYSFSNLDIRNNLFVSDIQVQVANSATEGQGGLFCAGSQASQSPSTIEHNDIFNRGVLIPSQCQLGAANLTTDPQFLDPANGDFHTQRTSPVVAAGDTNAPLIPPADLDGKARTVCGTIDMGAYEVRPRPVPLITSTLNPSVGGSSVTFTARLQGNCNVPTGPVTFLDGGKPLGTATLDANAIATLSTANLTVSTHTITATYPGDFNFDSSTSAPYTQVVTG